MTKDFIASVVALTTLLFLQRSCEAWTSVDVDWPRGEPVAMCWWETTKQVSCIRIDELSPKPTAPEDWDW